MFSPIVIIAQLALPIGLLVWVAVGRNDSRAAWGVKLTLVVLYTVAIALGGLWPVHPSLIPGAYLVALLGAGARSFRRSRPVTMWPATRRARASMAFRGGMALLGAALVLHVLSGRRPPLAPAIDLAFPLAGGTYHVVNGGSRQLINSHLMTLSAARFRDWRGQSYGIDLVRLNRGSRARGLLPDDPAAYAIFGDPVLAPCTGDVIAAVDGLRDLSPPAIDREHMAGNHVMLVCGDAWILVGHLQQSSVCVTVGQRVATGTPIGRVGNTGNTNEPHLHIHAQRPGSIAAPLGGDPLVIRFGGRYLARNALITREARR